jgi:tetratricopeptide (TPR) repeat protein
MRRHLVVIMCMLIFHTAVSAAQDVVIIDTESQYQLAQTLLDEQEFLAAANEFIRFIHLFPDHSSVPQAQYQAGLAFFYAGRTREAERHLKTAAYANSPAHPVSVSAMFTLGELYVMTDRPGDAVMVLRNLLMLSEDDPTKDKACFMLGWLMLDHGDQIQANSDYPVYPVKQARKYFSMISEDGQKHYRVQTVTQGLDSMQHIRQKNPKTAGILSIIPGAGFLYTERYRDALVSFLWNTTLILAAYKSFENDNPFLGGAVAFVESGFYAGNIYGAVTSAHKYNQKKKDDYIETLKQKHARTVPGLSFQAGQGCMEMAVMFSREF